MSRRVAHDMTVSGTISTLAEAKAAFEIMTVSLDRIKEAGRIAGGDTVAAADQFLSATPRICALGDGRLISGRRARGSSWLSGRWPTASWSVWALRAQDEYARSEQPWRR